MPKRGGVVFTVTPTGVCMGTGTVYDSVGAGWVLLVCVHLLFPESLFGMTTGRVIELAGSVRCFLFRGGVCVLLLLTTLFYVPPSTTL